MQLSVGVVFVNCVGVVFLCRCCICYCVGVVFAIVIFVWLLKFNNVVWDEFGED